MTARSPRLNSAGWQYSIACTSGALFALLALVFYGAPAGADVVPNGLFTNGAVLQRNRPIPVWGTAAEGERVTVTIRDRRAVTVARGARWRVSLPSMPAGGPYVLSISGRNRLVLANILVGDVYICSGQSNMEWPLALAANATEALAEARDPLLHLYTVPRGVSDTPAKDVAGQWQPCTPDAARGFSAVAFFFGRSLRRTLSVPIGLVQSAWSATPAQAWTSRDALLANPEIAPLVAAYEQEKAAYSTTLNALDAEREKALSDPSGLPKSGAPPPALPRAPSSPTNQSSPATLFNAMIVPLATYGIRGVIWYQGESNTGSAYLYRTLFPAMISNWRSVWKQGDFPFLFVQLAPFMSRGDGSQESAWAELRDAQLYTSRTVPNTGMAVITDVGDEYDIHPRDKQTVGERLALLARSLLYKHDIEASGPIYDSMRVEGDRIVLSFQHLGGGLEARGGESLTDFTIAGEDAKFVPATATIRGGSVVVSSLLVIHPVAVRYGWADYPQGNLWNRAGLPASPFRTDSFPLTTQPRRGCW